MLNALRLNGTTDALLIAQNAALLERGAVSFTLEAWIRTMAGGRRMQILSCGSEAGTGQSAWFFVNAEGRLGFDLRGWSGPVSDVRVNDAQWHHVAVVGNESQYQLYVDGRPTGGARKGPTDMQAGEAWIGAATRQWDTPAERQWRFEGDLSEVRIWTRPLSPAEIQASMTTRPRNDAPGLVGSYPLNGPNDLSCKARHLTVLGAPGPHFEPNVGPTYVEGSFVPTGILPADVQRAIQADPSAYARFGAIVDSLNIPAAQMNLLATITTEQWTQVVAKLQSSPNFQAQVQAYKQHKKLELPQEVVTKEVQEAVGGVGIGSSVLLGVAAAAFGIAAAKASTVFAAPFSIVSAVLGGVAALAGGVLGLIALVLQPLTSTLERGGQGGAVWLDTVKPGSRLKTITIRHGNVIDGIQCSWMGADGIITSGPHHGGKGGTASTIELLDDEHIMEVSGAFGRVVDSLIISTNKRRLGPYGGSGGAPFTLTPPAGRVVGFYGRSGDVLDAIGIQDELFLSERKYFGGSGGIPFIDDVSRMRELKRVLVRSGDFVDTLKFEWVDDEDSHVEGPEYGGYALRGGKLSIFELMPGEYLTKITGRSGVYLDNITFHTSRMRQVSYGGSGGKPFEIDLSGKKILAFIGRYGRFIDGFGVLAKNV